MAWLFSDADVSRNLNRNVEAGVADGVVRIHVHHLWFELSQFFFAVVRVCTDDDAVTNAGVMSCRAVDRDNAGVVFATDDVCGETLTIINVINDALNRQGKEALV